MSLLVWFVCLVFFCLFAGELVGVVCLFGVFLFVCLFVSGLVFFVCLMLCW